MSKNRGIQLCLFMVTLFMCGLGIGVAANTDAQTGKYTVERLHPRIVMAPDSHGQFCRYEFFGAGPWIYTKPTEPTGWLTVVTTEENLIPEIMRFDGQFFRSPTGAKKQDPYRWCEVQMEESVTESKPVPPTPVSGNIQVLRGVVRTLMDHYTVREIQDAMDLYNGLPEEGAPEP